MEKKLSKINEPSNAKQMKRVQNILIEIWK